MLFDPEQIREELRANGIDIYPQKEFDEDAEDRMINEKIRVRISKKFFSERPRKLPVCVCGVATCILTGSACVQEMIPFAVVGSDQEYQVNGRRLLGRKTKWGTIEGTTSSAGPFFPLSFHMSTTIYRRFKKLDAKRHFGGGGVVAVTFGETLCGAIFHFSSKLKYPICR